MTRLVFALLAALGTCPAADLIVAAASDLAPAESALRQGYGRPVRFSFGASGSLLRQIENGAPFDAFLSANQQYVSDGIARGVLAAPAFAYADGRIALWSKSGQVRSLEQLKDPKIRHVAIANPAYAPYGAAAKRALEQAGLWKAVEPKIVYGESVRQTLQFAESGNADAAVVSWSLVFDRGGVIVPGERVRQMGAVVTRSGQATEARRFLEWLEGPAGQKILAGFGLEPGTR